MKALFFIVKREVSQCGIRFSQRASARCKLISRSRTELYRTWRLSADVTATERIASLARGRKVEEVIDALAGTRCGEQADVVSGPACCRASENRRGCIRKDIFMEKMEAFFQKRVEEYDSHMLTEVVGCREGYRKMAQLLPAQTRTLLDLGCGTGLELDEIFKRFPALRVTGVDLTQAMLDKLRQKHPENSLRSFVEIISSLILAQRRLTRRYRFRRCITLPTRKSARCTKVRAAIKPGGVYLECDYMVETQQEEDHWFAEGNAC